MSNTWSWIKSEDWTLWISGAMPTILDVSGSNGSYTPLIEVQNPYPSLHRSTRCIYVSEEVDHAIPCIAYNYEPVQAGMFVSADDCTAFENMCDEYWGCQNKNAMTELCKTQKPIAMHSIPDTVGKQHTITSYHIISMPCQFRTISLSHWKETSFQCQARHVEVNYFLGMLKTC